MTLSNTSFFSVIIPTYNRAGFISQAINSVINQDYKNWELIIIDDGSTDNTRELINEYIKKDSRIKYFYQKNSERSIARNNGIKYAKGEWICFLDSDDYYHDTHLQRFVELIKSNNSISGLYFSGLSMNTYNDAPMIYNTTFNKTIEFTLFNSFSTPRACIHSKITKRYLFDKSIRIGEDTELWIRILGEFPLFYHNHRTVIQLEHDERSINADVFYCDLKTKKYILKKLTEKEISNKLRKDILSKCYFNIAKFEIKRDNKIRPILYLFLSLIKQPIHQQNKFKINLIISLLFSRKKTKNLIQ